jgi:hypothetical protein
MCRETMNWDMLTQSFNTTSSFENELPLVDEYLMAIRNIIFSVETVVDVVPVCSEHRDSMTVHEIMECYKVGKEYQDEEDPTNI